MSLLKNTTFHCSLHCPVLYLLVPIDSVIYGRGSSCVPTSVARLVEIGPNLATLQRQLNVISDLFVSELSSSMADAGLVDTLLRRVEEAEDGVDSLQVAGSLGLDHQAVVGAVKSLIALGEVSYSPLWSVSVTSGPTDATRRVIINTDHT